MKEGLYQSVFANINTSMSNIDYSVSVLPSQCLPLEPHLAVTIPVWKRVTDIVFSICFLFLFAPIMIFIALAIKVMSSGPIFFKQQRVGYKGRVFTLLKFRTMKVNTNTENHNNYMKLLIRGECTEREQPMKKLDEDNHDIFNFGKFLRVTCLDELPQMLNVIKGDMSLIGPRPCLIYEAKEFLPWHTNRFDILPGVTGLWQVNGKNDTTFREMIRLDLRYINNMSIIIDLQIIIKTVVYIISKILNTAKNGIKS